MRQFDEHNGALPFWRAHKIRFGDHRTSPEMIAEIAKLAYVEEVEIAHSVKLAHAFRRQLSEQIPTVQFLPNPFTDANPPSDRSD